MKREPTAKERKLMALNGILSLYKEDRVQTLAENQNAIEEVALMAYVNSELALAMIEMEVE